MALKLSGGPRPRNIHCRPEVLAPSVFFSLTPEQRVFEFSLLVTLDGTVPATSTVKRRTSLIAMWHHQQILTGW